MARPQVLIFDVNETLLEPRKNKPPSPRDAQRLVLRWDLNMSPTG